MKKILILLILTIIATGLGYTAFNINKNVGDNTAQNLLGTSTTPTLVDKSTTTEETLKPPESTTTNQTPIKKMNIVTLNTNKGKIELELVTDKPKTTENFVKLVSSGFYNDIRFHRVISGFMIQAGDPQSKDPSLKNAWGTGGPGYKFADELTGKEVYPQGTLAMANSGPNTNGSQFFIVTAQNAPLPPNYTVFGKVVSGMNIALDIEKVKRDSSDKPLEDVIITSASLK